jgi:hypothetical protein
MSEFIYKGMPKFSRPSQDEEIQALKASIYGYWYQFARLSPVLWFAHVNAASPRNRTIGKVSKDFGDLWQMDFEMWAKRYARSLFPEQQDFQKIEPYSPRRQIKLDERVIVVPMSIRRSSLMAQFKQFLNDEHPNNELNVLRTAHTARYKIHTKMYRDHVLDNERLVLIYRMLYPDTPIWVIADRLQLAPSNKVRFDGFHIRNNRKEDFDRLNSVGGRYLYKARRRLLNLERGSFPNASEIDVSAREQPFGRELHPEFVRKTQLMVDKPSAWKKWLGREYHAEILHEVQRRNPRDGRGCSSGDWEMFASGKKNSI